LTLNAASNVHKNDGMFDAMRTIGVILCVREVSYKRLLLMEVLNLLQCCYIEYLYFAVWVREMYSLISVCLCIVCPFILKRCTPTQMLHAAVAACFAPRFADIHTAVRTALGSLDLYGEAELVTPLACLAADMGISAASGAAAVAFGMGTTAAAVGGGVGGAGSGASGGAGGGAGGEDDRDLALTAALAKLNLTNNKAVLYLLPAAAAALFVSDKWDHSAYLPKLEAFENNEHCIQIAASKLFSSFFALVNSPVGPAYDPQGDIEFIAGPPLARLEEEAGKLTKRLAVRDRYKHYVERYLCISAQTLLVQREAESRQKSSYSQAQAPYRCLSILLEYFVSLSPIVSRGTLEKYFPNYLIHADLVDVSLGKQRSRDTLRGFSHVGASARAGGATGGGGDFQEQY
jgi:hypothetical protein